MPKIYTKKYTNDPIPGAKPPLLIPANKVGMFAIQMTPEGLLTRVIVSQLDGLSVGFTVDLFNSQVVLAPGLYTPPVALVNPDHYRIIATLTAVAGGSATLITPPGWAYSTVDGTLTLPADLLYILIQPTGNTNDSHWLATIQTLREAGG